MIERLWPARTYQDLGGVNAVSRCVFHRQGRPIGDFRKAWASACVAAGLVRV